MNKKQAETLCESPNMWGRLYTKRQAIKELMTRDIDDDTLRVIKIDENKIIIAYTC